MTVSPNLMVGLALLAVLVLVYVAVALGRKPRFRATAGALGADYVDTGWLAPGKIVGGDFSIEASTRPAGRSGRFRTTVRVAARDLPGPFHVGAGFFTGFPDWSQARVRARKRDRVFFTKVSVQRWVEPTSEERDRLLEWLSRASVAPTLQEQMMKEARIEFILLDEASVATSFGGIVSDPTRLRQAVAVLEGLAHRLPY